MIREASICSVTITTKRAKKTWSKGKNWNFDMNLRRPVRLQLSRKQDSYLADQSTTVLRCIWECSSQILVRRATKRPLRPKIGTARRTQNIPYPCCIIFVTPVCARVLPQGTLPHVCFTLYTVSDVSKYTHSSLWSSRQVQQELWEAFPGKCKMAANNTNRS